MHNPDPDPVSDMLGHALRRLRRDSGLTQVDLSKALDVDQTAVSRWETGKDAFPCLLIPAIERLLDVPAGALWAAAGLLKVEPVEVAVYADDKLDANSKRILLNVYSTLAGQQGGSGSTGR